jgi:hypothetical protein
VQYALSDNIYGGLIYYYGNSQSIFVLLLSVVKNITVPATCLGGAIYIDGSSSSSVGRLTIDQNNFEFLKTAKQGGALFVNAATFTFLVCIRNM